MNITVRKARPADLTSIVALERGAGAAAHWTEAQHVAVMAGIGGHRVLVLEESGLVQGFLVARAAGPEWEIENIAVAEPVQRNGFAGRMVRELLVEAHAEHAHQVWLEVRESNVAARGLYRKSGFLESGRRAGYYREPAEDAILYKLTLPGP